MLRLIRKSLTYHARMNVALALGVAAATAVITGALVVGDSMRGSLRDLMLDRLGQIDEAVVSENFFRANLANLSRDRSTGIHAAPLIFVPGSLTNTDSSTRRHAAGVNVLGCNARFWALGSARLPRLLGQSEIVLNEPLADALSVKAGDEVLLRVGHMGQIPADSPLGRKTDTVRTRRFSVASIIPAKGLGRFALRPNQQSPHNAYVELEQLQALLEQPGRANILVAGLHGPAGSSASTLRRALQPELTDLGLELKDTRLGYFNLTSTRMLLEPSVEKQVRRQLEHVRIQPALTYLANTIAARGHEIPYSTITAIDFAETAPLGPLRDFSGKPVGKLADDEIVLNPWAAEDLDARVGDHVRITYFEPESTHGQVRERTAQFRLKAVVPLNGIAADRNFTPELKGITDQLSIGDWDPPFPFEAARVRKKDEEYWDKYRATPKAFVSLTAGRKLWASRFGQTTSLRISAPGQSVGTLAKQIHIPLDKSGLQFLPLREMGLMAAEGTTSFSALFLGFSFFIVAAALMLITLLVRLAVQQRSSEIGILSAAGWRVRKIALLLTGEGFVVATLGASLGVGAGVGYAWLMLAGLRTWWLSAISTPFLTLHVSPRSLAVGLSVGMLLSLVVILWSIRRIAKMPVTRMLVGRADELGAVRRPAHWAPWLALALIVAAAGIGIVAMQIGGEAQAGAFFASGALVLTASLLWLRARLRSAQTGASIGKPRFALVRLAVRNGARNPGRSTLTVGLLGSATFLIVAMSAFRLNPEEVARGRNGGSGGFALVAQSDQPIFHSLGTQAGREELGADEKTSKLLASAAFFALRVKPGDDASCLNLYQAAQPRVLGVPHELVARGGFNWATAADGDAETRSNPWRLLERELPRVDGREVIPVVLDMNTAMYSLHLWKGVGEQYDIPDGRGGTLRLQVVGLLRNSILQGDLLMSERNLLRHFPELSGYRFFLIDVPSGQINAVRAAVEDLLADYGFDAQKSVERLADFFAVQNTYLSTFQTLGGLGLLLGTFGLATVQLRSVLERRGELALMRAAGFRKRRLAAMVLLENAFLLLGGLSVGLLAALVAVLPHSLTSAASLPWLSLALTFAAIVAIGLAVGLISVRAVMRAPLLPALRAET